MAKAETGKKREGVQRQLTMGTRAALWWLRHYESIVHLWIGFNWVWVALLLLGAVAGHLELKQALLLIFVFGVVTASGAYLGIKTLSSHLKHLRDGPEKEEAHELMTKIIKRRLAIMH